MADQEIGRTDNQRGQVLVIEDDPGIAELIEDSLREAGYEVHAFASADAAAPTARAGGFDLLLTDLRMHGASPFELAAQARRRGIPVIVTTGDAARADEIEGDWAVLRKPFRMSALLRALAASLPFGPIFLRNKAQQCRTLAARASDPALVTRSIRSPMISTTTLSGSLAEAVLRTGATTRPCGRTLSAARRVDSRVGAV